MIGRDLVRLLQNVARIPEFELLWKDIIHNPQALSPQFTGEGGRGIRSLGGGRSAHRTAWAQGGSLRRSAVRSRQAG